MSVEANMQAIIENRNSNFYGMFYEYEYGNTLYSDTTVASPYNGMTAAQILEEEETFGDVPEYVLKWAKDQEDENNLYNDAVVESPYNNKTAAQILKEEDLSGNVPEYILNWVKQQKKSRQFVPRNEPDFNFVPSYEIDKNDPASEKPAQTADDILKEKLYTARLNKFKSLEITIEANMNVYYTDDESSDFFGYTYDEILGMHANGVSIPDEVLDWANSMADENSTETNENTEGSDAQTLYTALKNSPFMNIKTIAKIFVKKSDDEAKKLDAILEDLLPIEKEMDVAAIDAQTKREESVKNIEILTKEWLVLEEKVENGEQLDANEQERFEELQELFGKEDKNYQENIDSTTKNYNKFAIFLENANIQSNVAIDFGEKTVEVAAELADFEKTHKRRGLLGGLINLGLGGVLSAWGLAGSKNFSQLAQTIGNGTVHFAQDVQTTIAEVNALMGQTAENAKFDEEDPNHIVEPLSNDTDVQKAPVSKQKTNSNDGLTVAAEEDNDNAADVVLPTTNSTVTEGDDTAIAGEGAIEGAETSESTEGAEGSEETDSTAAANGEEEEVSDEQLQEDGERSLEEVDAKKLSHPQLKRLVKEEGDDSNKKGKEALKLVRELKAQAQVVEDKEQEVEDANTDVEETSTEVVEAGAENAEQASDEGMSDEGVEEVANAETTAEQTVAEYEGEAEKEELTIDGLRKTFKDYKKSNKKYSSDVKLADKTMKEDIVTGGFTIAGGGYMTAFGVVNISTGTSLLATAFLCPASIAMAYYLINMGIVEIALGMAMVDGGTALTVSAVEGLEINDVAKEKIGASNEDIETANTSLDEFEATQVEAAEGEEGDTKTEGAEGTEETEGAQQTEDAEGQETEGEGEAGEENSSLSKDEQLLVDMGKETQELPPMMMRANKEGQISSKAGKDNVVQMVGLTKQIPSLIETTIAFETEKQAKEASEAAGETEDAPEVTAQDPAEIYANYRNDFKSDLKQNSDFKKDINLTKTEAKENLGLAATGAAAGTARTALGAAEIVLGMMLAANFWNPFQMMIGLALIKKGTEDVALGNAMLLSGLALTLTSVATLAVSEVSDEKIDESNERTNNALTKVDAIEAEINSAVQEQLAAEDGQDMSGMSVIQLLTLIIANGIKSTVLSEENTELLDALKEKLPEIMEKINGEEEASTEAVEAGDNAEAGAQAPTDESSTQEQAQAAEGSQGGEGSQGENSPFTKYILDFQNDLKTNEVYANEVKKATQMKKSIKGGLFLGAPVEKANAKIHQSTEQTQTALDETLSMEAEYKKAVEETKAKKEEGLEEIGGVELSKPQGADEKQEVKGVQDTEYNEENAKIPEYNCVEVNAFGKITHMETAPADITEDKVAEKEEEKLEKVDKKNEKKMNKEAKKEKNLGKKEKSQTKELEGIRKETETLEKQSEAEQELVNEQEELVNQQQQLDEQNVKEGEDKQAEGENQSASGEAAISESANKLAETTTISAEAAALAAEVVKDIDDAKKEISTKTQATKALVNEMKQLNTELQQDQAKMGQINTQIAQESKKESGNNSPAQQPQQAQQSQPQPQQEQQPVQQPKPVRKPKKAKKAEPKPEEQKPENKPAQQALAKPAALKQAPAQQPQAVVTEQEKPEGADKTQYASDLNKAPEFVGFVAQSDSLASGAVLAGKTKKTPVANNKQTQAQNPKQAQAQNPQQAQATNKQQQAQAQRKAQTKAKAEAKQEEQEEQKAERQAQQQAKQQAKQQVKPAQRATQKPFDINSMPGGANGGGAGKTQQLKQSAQQMQAQAFNKRARLANMAIRANNNVQATIQKEAQAQADAARKQREEAEKQAKIAKIKQYAGYVQGVGSILATSGALLEAIAVKVGTGAEATINAGINLVAEGTGVVNTGTSLMTQGVAGAAKAMGLELTGTAQVTCGQAQITIGVTQTTAGTAEEATGAATVVTGTTTELVGVGVAATGATLAACIFTAPASPPPTVAGGLAISSGIATQTTGGTITVAGVLQQALGASTQVTGSTQVATGTATKATSQIELQWANMQINLGQNLITEGAASIATGSASIASGATTLATCINLKAAAAIIKQIGVTSLYWSSMVSAGADIANGNILGGITTIVGAIASSVGASAAISPLAQAGIQLAASGTQLAGQIAQMNQNQPGEQQGGQKKQPNQKKMQKIQNNQKTNNIVQKTQKKKQTVGNRFNK